MPFDRPEKLPEWATDPGADVVEPTSGQKGDGWDVNDKPPAGWLNWLHKTVYNWLAYYQNMVLDNRVAFDTDPVANFSDVIHCIYKSTATDPAFWVLAGSDGVQVASDALHGMFQEVSAPGNFECGHATGASGQSHALIAGIAGVIRTSLNGSTWTLRTAAGGYSGNFLGSCVYYYPGSGTRYQMLVGGGGEIQYSSDGGLNWNQATAAGGYSGNFRAICAGAYGVGPISRMVAVGDSGEIQYADAPFATWTKATPAGGYTGDFYSVTWGPKLSYENGKNVFVAVGENDEVQYSFDGVTWYQAASYPTVAAGHLRSIEWALPGFLAVGDNHKIISSQDGQNWVRNYPGDKPPGNLWTVGTDLLAFYIPANAAGLGGRNVIIKTMRTGNYY